MRARSNPWLAVLTLASGAVLAASAAGCGGKTDDLTPPADTGTLNIVDSATDTAPVDTGTPVADSGSKEYDAPGSLYDAEIPDITFDGGTTAAGCYDCTLDQCKTEVDACDTDARCRGLLLCVLTKCAGGFGLDACAFGCAADYDVTSLMDEAVLRAGAVGQCVQGKCAGMCPSAPIDAGPADATSDTSGDSSAFKHTPPPQFSKAQSMDPRVIDVLRSAILPYEGSPASRDRLVKHLSH